MLVRWIARHCVIAGVCVRLTFPFIFDRGILQEA